MLSFEADRQGRKKGPEYRYPARPLLGFSANDQPLVRDTLRRHFAVFQCDGRMSFTSREIFLMLIISPPRSAISLWHAAKRTSKCGSSFSPSNFSTSGLAGSIFRELSIRGAPTYVA
ncbi:phage virion morphogenesis protein [Collimonas sp. PA-H2]|uniref:phage virion morphogenesis protein n=1 Tax=Collimonas sp. PA-H2 TaxID=1881062 RepID=UPI001E536926|nr:phage virion morphogenesis protein [Collimonas sp. PA-H2]